jgi:hypothetical protein
MKAAACQPIPARRSDTLARLSARHPGHECPLPCSPESGGGGRTAISVVGLVPSGIEWISDPALHRPIGRAPAPLPTSYVLGPKKIDLAKPDRIRVLEGIR